MTDLFVSVNLIRLEGLKLPEGFSRLQLDVPTRTQWLIIITVETAMSSHNLYGFGIILTLMLLIFFRLFFIHLKLEKLLYLLKIYIFKYNY